MVSPSSGVFAQRSSYLDRWVQIGVASGNLISVSFPVEPPGDNIEEYHPVLERLMAYLDAGEDDDFVDVETGLTVPTEHRHIFETVRGIPFGSTWSTRRVAARTAALDPGEEAIRTVQIALGANPIPIVVPDHRVEEIEGATGSDVRRLLQLLEGID